MKNFWFPLTTVKAANLFLMFFFMGIAFLFLNVFVIVAPSLCIIIYSSILWRAQSRHAISLSAETKDSPYFLGFLFTLIALLNIFYHLPRTNGQLSESFTTIIVPQIGTALLTTVLGLLARHIIVSRSPSNDENENIWKSATEELKENAGSYR